MGFVTKFAQNAAKKKNEEKAQQAKNNASKAKNTENIYSSPSSWKKNVSHAVDESKALKNIQTIATKKALENSETYKRKVGLSSTDGTNHGNIRYGTYIKLQNFENVTDFADEEEKKAVEAYKKYPGIQVPIGNKTYTLTYDGYKSAIQGTWDKYKPAESEKEFFNYIKTEPLYDLEIEDSHGGKIKFGKASYNYLKSLENGAEYYPTNITEINTANAYNKYVKDRTPKTASELSNEANQRIINRGKEISSLRGEAFDAANLAYDDEYYASLVPAQEKEKIWGEYDNLISRTIRTTEERNAYLNELEKRKKEIGSLWSDTDPGNNAEVTKLRKNIDNVESAFSTEYQLKKGTYNYFDEQKRVEELANEANAKFIKITDGKNTSGKYKKKTDLSQRDVINLSNLNNEEKYDLINSLHNNGLKKGVKFTAGGADDWWKSGFISAITTEENIDSIKWKYMTKKEVELYNKAYAISPSKANEYLEELDEVLRQRLVNERNKVAENELKDEKSYGKEHPYAAGLVSVPRNIISAPVALIDNIHDMLTRGEIDAYDATSMFHKGTQAFREGGSEYMLENYGEGASWAYNTAISILENITIMALTGGIGNAAGLGVKATAAISGGAMSLNAASDAMISAADRGGNNYQVVASGITAFLSEYMWERLPVEKIMSIKGGSVVRNALAGAMYEIPTEMATEVTNIIADTSIMSNQSESAIRTRHLIANEGMTAEEATKTVWMENLDRVLQAGASGGVSGGMISGGKTMINNAIYTSKMNPITRDMSEDPIAVEKMVNLGKQLDIKEAKIVGEMIAKNENPSNGQIRKMVDKVVKESVKRDASLPNLVNIIGTIEGHTSDYYDSPEAINTANAIYDFVNGTATKEQNNIIENSDGARAIILASENTIDGTKNASAWNSLVEKAISRQKSKNIKFAEEMKSEGAKLAEYTIAKKRPFITPTVASRYSGATDAIVNDAIKNKNKIIAVAKDNSVYSTAGNVHITNEDKLVGNVVQDEVSKAYRTKNPIGYKVGRTFAKDLGMPVKYVDGLVNEDGEELDGVITGEGVFINIRAKNPTRFATTHEFSHRMKRTGGKVWQKYQNYVIKTLKNTESSTEGKSLYDIKREAKKGVYAENDIDEEIAADYIGEMFADVNELSKFIRDNRKQAFSVRNAYYAVLDKLGLLDEKKKAQRLWAKAYREAMKNKDEVQNAEYGVRSESKESKSGTRVDDNSENQYNNTEQYRTMWTIEENVLSRSEVRQFYSEIQNLANGSEKYEISLYGDYIFEIGNNLVYTDGNFEYPTISKVIKFDTEYEGDLEFAKELILNEERTQSEISDAIHLIEEMYGYGYVSERDFENSRAYARQRRNGKRTNSTTVDKRIKQSVSGTRVVDAEYLELAKNPKQNEEKLQAVVDEAAVKAGVETDKNGEPIGVYHGTSSFGFTKLDTQYSDDKLTFWATTDINVAGSYKRGQTSTHNEVKQIGKPNPSAKPLNPRTNSAEEILKTVSKVYPEYKDAYVPSEKDKLKKAKKNIKLATKYAKKLDKFKEATAEVKQLANDFISAAKDGSCDALSKVGAEAWSLSSKFTTDFENSTLYEDTLDSFYDCVESVYEIVRPDYFIKDGESEYSLFVASRYNDDMGFSGIYKMYFKTENPYVIDCKGVQWNQIVPPKEISPDGTPMNTRQIAQWAFDKGYDSVKYENAVDMGNKKAEATPATVIAFMQPQNQLWSADPVTYDDNGNVIPPSERFSEKKELRYSVAGTRVTDSTDATARESSLMEENKRLREQIENMHIQLDQAEGKGLDLKAIKTAAEKIKKAYFSNIKTSVLHQELAKLYRLMASNEASGDEIADRIKSIAEKVIDKATEKIEFAEYKSLLDDIKNTKLAVPEADKASFADGYDNFRKSNRGKIKLNDEGYPVDAFWDDLVSEYPELFSDELRGSEERLNRILEVREEFQTVEEEVFRGDEIKQKAVTALSNDIMESFFNIPEGGEGKFVFYDKRASQAERELNQAKQKFEKVVNRLKQRIERNAEIYDAKLTKAKEKTEKLRDRYDREKVTKGIDRTFGWLNKMYTEPTDTRHIPQHLLKDIGNIIDRITFATSKSGEKSVFSVNLDNIDSVYKKILANAWDISFDSKDSYVVDTAFKQDLEEMAEEISSEENVKEKRIEDMTTEELKTFYEMLTSIHHAVTNSNKAFNESNTEGITEQTMAVDKEMEDKRALKTGSGEYLEATKGLRASIQNIGSYFSVGMFKPYDFFHRIGGTTEKLYGHIRKSFRGHIKNLQKFQKTLEKATKGIKVKKIAGVDSFANYFSFAGEKVEKIELLGGAKINLGRGDILSLYATYLRPQGKEHILGGGIVTGRVWTDENGHKRTGTMPIEMNEHDLGTIFETITPKEREMVKEIVDFMSKECAKWGNEASMKFHGYEKFGEGWYFPIKVWDGAVEKSSAIKGQTKLTGKSFTKKLVKGANNAIVIENFFDVVLNHVNAMSMYNTIAPALTDMERVFNKNLEKTTSEGNTITSKLAREGIKKTFGTQFEEYMFKWMQDLNGNTGKVDRSITSKFVNISTKARIAYKLSVALKQWTSVVRAFDVVSPKYFITATLKSLGNPVKAIRETKENMTIALWKSWGFRDPAMGTGLKESFLDTETFTNKTGYGLYGLIDDFTFSVIYKAVKNEVKHQNKDIDVNSEKFMELVEDRFDYVIDRTQVVDSPFHTAQVMRSNNPLNKVAALHMSEPITTYNLLMTDLYDALETAKQTGKKSVVPKKLARSAAIFAIGSYLIAMMGAIPKATKDEPEKVYDKETGKYLGYWDRVFDYTSENFVDEINPLKLLPIIRDVFDLYNGWTKKDVTYESLGRLASAAKDLFEDSNSGKKNVYAYTKNFVSAVAEIFGLPYGNAYKELEGIYLTIARATGNEAVDYWLTKSKWDVTDKKNRSKFMKYYDLALKNGHPEDAAEIFSDYYGVESDNLNLWTAETERLYKSTKSESVFYNSPSDEFSFGENKKVELTDKQYKEYEKNVNKEFLALFGDLVKSDHYKGLTDEEKANEIADLREWVQFKEKMKYYPVDLDDNKHAEEVLDEFDALYIETGKAPLSKLFDNSFSVSDNETIELDDKQYEKYLDGSYDVLWNMAYEFVNSNEYDNLTADEKMDAFKNLKEYAKETQYFNFDDYEMTGWKAEVYTGEKSFVDSFIERRNQSYWEDNYKDWRKGNFNIDESKYSDAELEKIKGYEEDFSRFYTAHEMGRPYKESDYRRVQVYHDHLSSQMTMEEFASIGAYANAVAIAFDPKGSNNSLSKEELKTYLNTLDYDTKTKGALFEALFTKGTKNPYVGGKVGDGSVFPILTHSPEEGQTTNIKAPASEKAVENKPSQASLPGGYTASEGQKAPESTKTINRGKMSGTKNKQITKVTSNTVVQTPKKQIKINYKASDYNDYEITTIKSVEKDAISYYNAPRLLNYEGNPLRHMHIFETRLSKFISLEEYAKIRAEIFDSAAGDKVTEEEVKTYIDKTDYDAEVKEALFDAVGEEDWDNPYEEEAKKEKAE